jgi:hypothetical protein
MHKFGRLMAACPAKDSLSLLEGKFTKDDCAFATSTTFALLATAPKSKIHDFVDSKRFNFRKVAMATSYIQQVSLELFKSYWNHVEVADAVYFVGTGGGFHSCACDSVSTIIFSPSVDSVLWRHTYPRTHIMRTLRTCNVVASECPYDFCGDERVFRLWQSLNAYVACITAAAEAKLKFDDAALREAMGLTDWMNNTHNQLVFEVFVQKWDEIAIHVD